MIHKKDYSKFSWKSQSPVSKNGKGKLVALFTLVAMMFVFLPLLQADVSLTEKDMIKRRIHHKQFKVDEQVVKGNRDVAGIMATGAQALIDNSGLEWFINTDITFVTSSSASGAASEASYTHAVTASTSAGGTTVTTLSDAFDGYYSIAISLDDSVGPVSTGSASYYIYNQNGVGTTECSGRQVVLNPQVLNGIQVSRKIFVPANDAFCRWLNIFTNQDSVARTFNVISCNNFGSDSNNIITNTSDGDTTAELTDTWVTTMQNYTGSTSPDPRLGHIMWGPGAPTGLVNINFANGDDNPYWAYRLTLQPGQTAIIMHFAVAQPSKAAADAKCAQLVALPVNATQCMTATEMSQVVNFAMGNHTVRFTAGAGGIVEGNKVQVVPNGGRCTPVTAVPNTGFRFIGWTGSYKGTENPLTVKNVSRDMVIRATFENQAPTVAINSPLEGTTVYGMTNVDVTAADDSGISRVEIYVDGVLVYTSRSAPFTYHWDTTAYTPGTHTIRAVAIDAAGTQAFDQITVTVQNVTLTLTGARLQESAWLIHRDYARLDWSVANAGGVPVIKYVIYRKAAGGAFQQLAEVTGSSATNAAYTYYDKFIDHNVTYTYKVDVIVAPDIVVNISNEITL